ncbi:MAG: hypothetical protein E5Y10_27010 [Mesorhizobium sp.]|nr:MAG: hypothetical protein E5Y10_27010 [Mesorhizobium sp.]
MLLNVALFVLTEFAQNCMKHVYLSLTNAGSNEMPNTVRAAAEGMPKISRRSLMVGIAAAPAVLAPGAAALAAPVDSHERVELAISELAAAMAALHGGKWGTNLDHQAEFVAITRYFGQSAKTMHRRKSEDGTITDTWS